MEMDSSPEILGSASYVFTEEEFVAANRAARISRFRAYDSWITRLGVGVAAAIVWLALTVPGARSTLGGSMAPILAFAILGGWIVYGGRPFSRWRFHRIYRKSPFRDRAFEFQFTPSRLIHRGELSVGEVDWSFVRSVVELRDGFFILWEPGAIGTWIPKHAPRAPFGPDDLAKLLRSKVKRYRVINRIAALRPPPPETDGHFPPS